MKQNWLNSHSDEKCRWGAEKYLKSLRLNSKTEAGWLEVLASHNVFLCATCLSVNECQIQHLTMENTNMMAKTYEWMMVVWFRDILLIILLICLMHFCLTRLVQFGTREAENIPFRITNNFLSGNVLAILASLHTYISSNFFVFVCETTS